MGQDGAPKAALSRREQQVAALVAEGLTNRAIAQRMFISERTVDGHLEHIREKLGVTSRAQVATWYVAQPPAAAAPAMAPPAMAPPAIAPRSTARPSRRAFDALLLAAALTVLVLVAVLVVPRLFAPAGTTGAAVISYTGAAPGQFSRPQSVAVGDDGFIYVADTENFAIKKIDPKRRIITVIAGGIARGDFVDGGDALSTPIGSPTGLAIAPGGALFFANGDLIGRVDTDGTVHLVAAHPLRQPVAVALASDGTLFIADRAGNRVWRRSPGGDMAVVAGTGDLGFGGDGASALDAQLDHPMAVASDAAGDVLIADEGNNRIRRVDALTNVITTIAGSAEIYGFGGDGGAADRALLSLPLGVAVAPNGDVYISDTGNDRVRRVGKNAKIATVVGAHGELYGPGGLAISSSGDLYIADIGDNRVAVVHSVATR
jgi:DNA-binding CsgD family transcriptional regulator/DNA-binding beta-propeller fold protein YncE